MPYIILVILIIATILGGQFTSESKYATIHDLLKNLTSELIGALIVLVFVEKLFEKSEKRKLERLRKRGADIVNGHIINVLTAISELAGATNKQHFNFQAKSIGELFNDNCFRVLEESDWSRDTKKHPPRNWATQISNSAKGLKESIEHVLGLYGQFLEEKEIEWFTNIVVSPGIKCLLAADSIVNNSPPEVRISKLLAKNGPGLPPNNLPQEVQVFVINITNWLEISLKSNRDKMQILNQITGLVKITNY